MKFSDPCFTKKISNRCLWAPRPHLTALSRFHHDNIGACETSSDDQAIRSNETDMNVLEFLTRLARSSRANRAKMERAERPPLTLSPLNWRSPLSESSHSVKGAS
jgi:hypothetical protein